MTLFYCWHINLKWFDRGLYRAVALPRWGFWRSWSSCSKPLHILMSRKNFRFIFLHSHLAFTEKNSTKWHFVSIFKIIYNQQWVLKFFFCYFLFGFYQLCTETSKCPLIFICLVILYYLFWVSDSSTSLLTGMFCAYIWFHWVCLASCSKCFWLLFAWF